MTPRGNSFTDYTVYTNHHCGSITRMLGVFFLKQLVKRRSKARRGLTWPRVSD